MPCELVKLPVREHTLPDLVAGYRQFAELDLSHVDLVISGKYPRGWSNIPTTSSTCSTRFVASTTAIPSSI